MLQVWESDVGFPRPLMNREVLDLSGQVIAVVDLLEVESGTYGEYNGAAHRSRERQRRDEARADALRGVGLEGFVIVAGDSERIWRERMSSARGRALWLPEDQRRWRVGAFVPAPPLPDEDEVAREQIMLRTTGRWSEVGNDLQGPGGPAPAGRSPTPGPAPRPSTVMPAGRARAAAH